jgi:iron complex outermembrane receptor protein/hemoglobin/transferrin/lactoferrin receptor protein
MLDRVPRSAPDALRWEPGVVVQQTAHAQASPFVRGMTGQQVLLDFDGVRLNNGIFRQGPNQYFFTVDERTIERIDVIRGSASTRYGTDALGGVITATPIAPRLDPDLRGIRVRPRAAARFATADGEWGGRVQLEAQAGRSTGAVGGVGYRRLGLLEAGGPIANPADGTPTLVPRFAEDGRTQLGTGFRELTFDVRAERRITPGLRGVAAVYGYRQYDAPRTDRCPPPEQRVGSCLQFEEQFRTLAYMALRGDAGPLREVSLTVSYQRWHERRRFDVPAASLRTIGRDDVDTLGAAFRAATPALALGAHRGRVRFRYGADAYRDSVGSAAFYTFTDVGITAAEPRGQYVDGATYLQGGAYVEGELALARRFALRTGLRAGFARARAAAEARSGTAPTRFDAGLFVARAGVELLPARGVSVRLALDQGIRAPNLDDLTARTITGPGYQLENPALGPERTLSAELGARVARGPLTLDASLFGTVLENAILRAPVPDCPPGDLACAGARARFRLVNAPRPARIAGGELLARVVLPAGFDLRATVSYAIGDQGNPVPAPPRPSAATFASRVPLSRVPPLGGTAEVRWRHAQTGVFLGAGLRWSLAQDRLAPQDFSDPRIPAGGTPGWAVVDLRAGWRLDDRLVAVLVLDNVGDLAYRVHGSSINGPGRGLILSLSGGL